MFQVKLWHPIPIIQFFGICTNIHPLDVCRWRGPVRQVLPQRRRAARRKAGQERRSRSVQRQGRPGRRRRMPFLRQIRRSRPTEADHGHCDQWQGKFPWQFLLDSHLSQSPTECCLKFTWCLLRATFLLRCFYFYNAPIILVFIPDKNCEESHWESCNRLHFSILDNRHS